MLVGTPRHARLVALPRCSPSSRRRSARNPAPSFGGAALVEGKVLVGGDGSFAEPDLAFALRIWMSGLFRDDFETGDESQCSSSTGS